jgi:hypothetical protein
LVSHHDGHDRAVPGARRQQLGKFRGYELSGLINHRNSPDARHNALVIGHRHPPVAYSEICSTST